MIDITVNNRNCLHCGKPVRGLKGAPEIAIHLLSERRRCDRPTYAEFADNEKIEEVVPKTEIWFSPDQANEHKAKANHFVTEIEAICQRHDFSIGATDTDGIGIYNSEITGYTWGIGTPIEVK